MALIQAAGNDAGAGTNAIVTISASVASLVAACYSATTPTLPTDNKSNTWIAGPTNGVLYSWYCLTAIAGTTTIQVNGGSKSVLIVAEESLLTAFNIGTAQTNGGGGTWSSGNATTTVDNCVGYGFAACASNAAIAASGSWVAVPGSGLSPDGFRANATDGDACFLQRLVVGSAGIYSATGTKAATTVPGGVMFFNASAPPGVVGPLPRQIYRMG